MKITFLAPLGANFTDIARKKMATLFGQHFLLSDHQENLELVRRNEDVLPTVIKHGGFGVVAMETTSDGRYDGPVGSFLQLLDYYEDSDGCPTTILAALKMEVKFALMARKGVRIEDIRVVLGHEKSNSACGEKIKEHGWRFIQSTSNGQAAEDVAENSSFAKAAALGPSVAVEIYKRLVVLDPDFGRKRAVTTFYLLGPRQKKHIVGLREDNVSLLVCKLLNRPGTLVDVLKCFSDKKINLRNIRDFHVGSGEYVHVIHFDCRKNQARDYSHAMEKAARIMSMAGERHFMFGPFPVVEGVSA